MGKIFLFSFFLSYTYIDGVWETLGRAVRLFFRFFLFFRLPLVISFGDIRLGWLSFFVLG